MPPNNKTHQDFLHMEQRGENWSCVSVDRVTREEKGFKTEIDFNIVTSRTKKCVYVLDIRFSFYCVVATILILR